ncbi:hypothetical protein C8R43DRAFT_1019503 [Mycena crocata]|nr:hypothetical protein C8R43DRAFT_1019503 [Mycena crocata]
MRGLSTLPLDDDIVDRIMTFCPTFGTLQAMVSASKDFRRIFETHPKSITCAVAYNIVGPALPQALRFVRYPYPRLPGEVERKFTNQNDEYVSSDEEGEDGGQLALWGVSSSKSPDADEDAEESEDDDELEMDDFIEEDEDGSVQGNGSVQNNGSVQGNGADYNADSVELVDPITMATACPEDHLASMLTTKEKKELRYIAKDVHDLENAYSLTTKDRTSKTSVLTPAESFRFQRAMYRIMLYTRLFSLDQYDRDEIDALSAGDVEKIFQQRTAVLNEYPTDELLEIVTVVKFMREIFADIGGDSLLDTFLDTFLASGPRGALQAWQYRSYDGIADDYPLDLFFNDDVPFYAGYFSRAFNEIWAARKEKAPKGDEPASKWILDSISGANDTCSKCSAPGGLKLFTEANWCRLSVLPQVLLKAKLGQNPTLVGPFEKWWAEKDLTDSDDLGPWIASVFALRAAASGASTSSTSTALAPQTLATLAHASFAVFDGWDAALSYCDPCLRRFLEAHVWVWWLEQQLKAGWTPPEDCWYGYNCGTQRKPHHAQTKNHMCIPSKGDL